MKCILSEVIDSALTGEDTSYLSTTKYDKIICHRSKNITANVHKKELEKARTYNKQMLSHFIMIYFPNNQNDNISINSNKSDLINNWIKPITEILLKVEGTFYIIGVNLIHIKINYKFYNEVRTILDKKYQYNPKKRLGLENISILYLIFYTEWTKLFWKSRYKKVIPTNKDYENIFKKVDKSLKEMNNK